jgi:glycosyltransferase involved in cell wall biosynthesis
MEGLPAVLNGASIVVFADDWGIHPSSAQHLFRRFLDGNRVVWINTVGLRWPRPSGHDLKKVLRKVAHWSGLGRSNSLRQPEIHDLPLLPLLLGRLARTVNAWMLRQTLRRLVRFAQGSTFIVSTLPLTADLIGAIPGARFIYYAVDDYASWPGLSGKLVGEMDLIQARGADVVIASSQRLAALYQSRAQRAVHYLPHGVDVGHFARARQLRTRHYTITDVVFFGAIDERVDQSLLAEIVAARPLVRFLLVGPATRSVIVRGSNVERRGPVPYEKLPELLSACKVALLPYTREQFGMQISPLKAREALAAGLPVVASDVPELHSMNAGVLVGRSPDELAAALDRALTGQIEMPSLGELESDSWESRAEQFAEMLLEARIAA